MPSPFPGMDPYLEERARWPGLHQRLITYSAEALQPQLRPKYIAQIGERIQVAGSNYIPDIYLKHTLREPAPVLAHSGVLVADEPLIINALDDQRHIPYIEIIARDTGEVVTLIEILSPTNKEGKGREQYLNKREELLDTEANLVEIDLLGYGEQTILPDYIHIVEPADWRYLISISRAERRWENALEIYAIPLRERLPRCRIPLRPPDPDAVLDLPSVFTRCYDAGGYDLLIDYSQPPPVPLSDAEKEWAASLLQA